MLGLIVRSLIVLGSLIAVFLPAAPALAELPPRIMADRYLMKAEQLEAGKDYAGALKAMGQAIALQKKHGFEFPVEFHVKYARVALSADSIRIANESVNRYLSIAGPDGEFYKEALALSLEAEGPEILPEDTCDGKPVGSSCWMELANRPQCYIWNENPKKDETATWSGSCSGGVATGEGTLTFARIVADSIRRHQTVTGRLRKGKYDDGRFIVRDSDGDYMDVSRVDGERHGRFVVRRSDGSTEEGPYLNGERHGRWIIRDSYGRKKEGPYVNGSKHGHWVHTRDKNADPYFVGSAFVFFAEGPFVNGKKHGQWVWKHTNGYILKGSCFEGNATGTWSRNRGETTFEPGEYGDGYCR